MCEHHPVADRPVEFIHHTDDCYSLRIMCHGSREQARGAAPRHGVCKRDGGVAHG